MTSNDSSLDTNTIMLQFRELTAINREQIAEMKTLVAQIQKDNAEFRALMTRYFSDFKTSLTKELSDINNNVNLRLTEIHTEIGHINQKLTGLQHDVTGLYHWDYWLLSIILVIFAMPQIVSGVKALFSAVADGISGIMTIFKERK